MKNFLPKLINIFQMFFFDLGLVKNKWRSIHYFIRNLRFYKNANSKVSFNIQWQDICYRSYDRFCLAGAVDNHYFFQDIWAAKTICSLHAREHVDIGSRLDGFVAHLLTLSAVTYIDVRPLPIIVDGLNFLQGSILRLPLEDDTCKTLSCLHVIEHIGLGRYGDDVDPDGHTKAAKELIRVLKPGGTLLIGAPVGRERLCFDAHRIFDPETVLHMFEGLELVEFSLIDDKGQRIIENANIEQARLCECGCGLFRFTKPSINKRD